MTRGEIVLKLADFGTVRNLDLQPAETQPTTHQMAQTRSYAAPEGAVWRARQAVCRPAPSLFAYAGRLFYGPVFCACVSV